MANVVFNYLYRDGANYKNWGAVVFSNPENLEAGSVNSRLEELLPDRLFNARQIRLPEVFLFARGHADPDDHCFHEFHSIESTPDPPNDGHLRPISAFIREVERQAIAGWIPFDPIASDESASSYLRRRSAVIKSLK